MHVGLVRGIITSSVKLDLHLDEQTNMADRIGHDNLGMLERWLAPPLLMHIQFDL